MSYEMAIAEMKLEAEEYVINKIKTMIEKAPEFDGLETNYWSKKLYELTDKDRTITKLRAENRKLTLELRELRELKDNIPTIITNATDSLEQDLDASSQQIRRMEKKSIEQSEKYEELSYEIDEINRKWAEDNESNNTIIECQNERIQTLQNDLAKLDEYKDSLTGVCDYNDLVVYIENQKETIEKQETYVKHLREKNDDLTVEKEGMMTWDEALELVLEEKPDCVTSCIVNDLLNDGEIVSYETYEEMEETKDEYDGYLDDILELYKSKHTKGLHKDNELKRYYEDLPKIIEELYKLYEDMIIDRDYYKAGYESLKESSGEEVAIEMMEKIMDKTKDVAEKDIERVKEIHRLQMKINEMISGIRHQYKTRVAILDQCDRWKEKLIDIHNY